MRRRKTARPSNLPGKELEKLSLCRPRGRKAKIGPCAKCGTESRLVTGLCRRCYNQNKYLRYLARPEIIERKTERKVKRAIKEKEKQLHREKWRTAHPGWKHLIKGSKQEPSPEGSPSWVADWLKHQAENYLRENAGHFDRNGTRPWAMTEEQVIGLCRIIYMAKHHHNDKRGYQAGDNYARRDRHREGEGDGLYLDRPISPELRRLK